MELEKNMYVRTENGIIEKINQIYDRHATDNIVVWLNGYGDGKSVFIDDFEEIKFQSINSRGFIKKEPSFNIIDLIEVGDYVNGFMVEEIGEYHSIKTNKAEIYAKVNCSALLNCFYEEDIKTIVTKEQFESMKYSLEG